jgi:ammonium transporter, Amt family
MTRVTWKVMLFLILICVELTTAPTEATKTALLKHVFGTFVSCSLTLKTSPTPSLVFSCNTEMTTIPDLQGNLTVLQEQLTNTIADYNESLDTIWILLTGLFVWFMSAGFAFLELGGVRAKNSQNILAKNLLVPVLTFIGWYFLGYGFAFGTPEPPTVNRFIGSKWFVHVGMYASPSVFKYWFFQGAFADTTASIVSGATAERMCMTAFMIHTVIMTTFIYPVCVYWAWSGAGWLNFIDPVDGVQKSTIGPWYQDWAGSGVIHLVGGTAGLIGAILTGPRKGRFDAEKAEALSSTAKQTPS